MEAAITCCVFYTLTQKQSLALPPKHPSLYTAVPSADKFGFVTEIGKKLIFYEKGRPVGSLRPTVLFQFLEGLPCPFSRHSEGFFLNFTFGPI